MLIVEDDPESANALGLALAMAGFSSVTARDGTVALELAHQHLPHAVILDLGLPPRGGLAVARAFRDDPSLAPARIIALTGFDTQRHRAAASAAGIDEYLVKPGQIDQIVAAMQAVRAADANLFGFLEERLNGTEDIQTSGARDYMLRGLDRLLLKRWQVANPALHLDARIIPTPIWVFALAYAAAHLVSGQLHLSGALTIGSV
ncbi:MAG TPA: response regulator, partial [Burkholderiaceae bacterium]|nr:response regulator [Burkholderiaceae bacterium]